MNKKKFLLFLAVSFAGLLCYAVYNALAIYIPQQRERRDFKGLRERVQAAAEAAGGCGEAAGGRGKAASGVGSADSAADEIDAGSWLSGYRALQERNGDFRSVR